MKNYWLDKKIIVRLFELLPNGGRKYFEALEIIDDKIKYVATKSCVINGFGVFRKIGGFISDGTLLQARYLEAGDVFVLTIMEVDKLRG